MRCRRSWTRRHERPGGNADVDADHPIGGLVLPLLEPVAGGVLFGVDPVTGRSDRQVVSTVRGGPEALVAGEADGRRYELDRSGATVSVRHALDGVQLAAAHLRALAELAARAAFLFGGPQDIEWALDDEDALWLLQTRAVTTTIAGVRPRDGVRAPSRRPSLSR